MQKSALLLPWIGLMMLAACGPNTDIPATDGSAVATSVGSAAIQTTTITSGILGNSPLATTTSGGNANNVAATTATGTVAISGSINGNTFTAQDAVFGVAQTADGLVIMTVVISDQPNLCAYLADQTGAANLVLAYLSSTNPNTYPVANTYPVTNPSGAIPDAVTADSAFSRVAFAAVGASSGTFASAGQVQISTTAKSATDPETMAIQATDAAGDSVQGTLTPAYCNSSLLSTSALVKRPTLVNGLR